MARLLDWLAWKYNVLFVVSAGNHYTNLELDVPRQGFAELAPSVKDGHVLQALWRHARLRRLLSPAESVNALTVAAAHADASQQVHPRLVSLFDGPGFPSPVNAIGLGFGRSVKPDLLAPGGRQSYMPALIATADGSEVLQVLPAGLGPGITVASGGRPGELSATIRTQGSSNAAALTSGLAARVYQMLEDNHQLPDTHRTVATKCLVAHSAGWPTNAATIANALGTTPRTRRREITRFFGYGLTDEQRSLVSSDQRVTMIGWGTLQADESELYEIPLPPSLSGARLEKRLTISLAWFTPTNFRNRKYREAALWFETVDRSENQLTVSRTQVEYDIARRGTLQHDIFEGAATSAFVEGDVLRLRVSCREHAGGLEDERIPYALAISIEVAEATGLQVYDEIANLIRPRVRVGANV